MTFTIELPEEEVQVLAAKARACGVSAEEYARQALKRDLEEGAPEPFWKAFTQRMHSLPNEAFESLPTDGASEHDHYLYGKTVSNARSMVDLATAISTYRQAGTPVPAGHAFEWINAFDVDELRGLLNEVYGAFRSAMDAGTSWDDFEAVLHEWHESAIALCSDTLAAAFAAPAEEVPLTPPVVPVECGADV